MELDLSWSSKSMVEFNSINQELFREYRSDWSQEELRKLILLAFKEAKNNPKRYGKFYIMRPRPIYCFCANPRERRVLANRTGGHLTDWVEQCLEWALKITNGYSWSDLCNENFACSGKWLIEWQDSRLYYALVGYPHNASINIVRSDGCIDDATPLVTFTEDE